MIKNHKFGVYLLISDFLVESLKTNKDSQKDISGWCQKKKWHRSRIGFLEHLESKCLYIPVNLRSKISGEGLNNFLQADHCLGLVKCFKIFHFNYNFWKFNYFLAFWYFHLNAEIFQTIWTSSMIVAKFLLRVTFSQYVTHVCHISQF